jgi:hypothetical protein
MLRTTNCLLAEREARLRRIQEAARDVVNADAGLREAKALHPRLVAEMRMQKVEAIEHLRALAEQPTGEVTPIHTDP